MKLKNRNCSIEVENGRITHLKILNSGNIADKFGNFGTVCYTFGSDDIKNIPHEAFETYKTRECEYNKFKKTSDNKIICADESNKIFTEYKLSEKGLNILAKTQNENISEFGVNINLNFSGKRGSDYKDQFLPTTPYTSQNGEYMYFILTEPNGNFLTVTAKTKCDGWKIKYSPYSFGHFILNLQFLASFDKAYNGSGRKNIEINFRYSNSLNGAFKLISEEYKMPLLQNILSGGFDGNATLKLHGNADLIRLDYPSGKTTIIPVTDSKIIHIKTNEFGLHTVTPVLNGTDGLNTTIWNGQDITELFDKSCDTIKKPYHPDDNLCEGGCFLWEFLMNMRIRKNRKYNNIALKELDIIMCKTETPISRRSIAPFAQNGFAPYHIYNSKRVQEQFFGASILLEAYKLYGEKDILEYAINTLNELVDNYMIHGKVYNGEDYTTVCCPMIPLVDMTLFLKENNDNRYIKFENAATLMAEYLYKRGFEFPTEGTASELSGKEFEDGSISCTALALLYYCYHIKNDKKYSNFAMEVLDLHKAWTMYTPDARIYGSSFRWWETIWEGDGDGPAICAGHAWTIWKAEALYYLGIIFKNDEAMLDSWNGYITNFSKTMQDGSMYSCYEPDYICGGGNAEVKLKLKQLSGENTDIVYEISRGYPKHKDNSLSRYAWIRAAESWLNTAAVLNIDKEIIAINAQINDDVCTFGSNITQVYVSNSIENLKIDSKIKII